MIEALRHHWRDEFITILVIMLTYSSNTRSIHLLLMPCVIDSHGTGLIRLACPSPTWGWIWNFCDVQISRNDKFTIRKQIQCASPPPPPPPPFPSPQAVRTLPCPYGMRHGHDPGRREKWRQQLAVIRMLYINQWRIVWWGILPSISWRRSIEAFSALLALFE